MTTTYDYERLNITVCPMEKDTVINRESGETRMAYIQDFFESHGATVVKKYLPYIDYSITGQLIKTTDGKDEIQNISMGIQVKTLSGDFFPSLPTLPDTLFRAFSVYQDVSLLVVENGGYDIALNEDGSDGLFQNKSMQNGSGKAGLGLYSSYTNFMASMQRFEVHARSVRQNEHIPMTIVAMIKFAGKPLHEGLRVRPLNYSDKLMNVFGCIEGIGSVSAQKLLQYIPSIEALVNADEKKLQDILGLLKGKQTYHFLHSNVNDATCSVNWSAFLTGNKKLDMPKKDFLTKPKVKKDPKLGEINKVYNHEKNINQKIVLSQEKQEELEAVRVIQENKSEFKIEYIEGPTTPLNFKSVEDRIRLSPCTMKDLKSSLGWSEMAIFNECMVLKEKGKIWKNNKTRLWEYGSNKNEVPVVPEKEMDIGV